MGLRDIGASLFLGSGEAVHLDPEGRLRRAFFPSTERRGVHFLRGLDGRLLRKDLGEGVGSAPTERRAVFERVHAIAQEALASHPSDKDRARGETPRAALEAAAAWTAEKLEGESARFLSAYRPLGILPPDRYGSLILQATEGCSWNRCTFCALYRGRHHRAKTLEEFRGHVASVKRFLGRSLASRRGVFLSEANALSVPLDTLRAMVRIIEAEVPVPRPLAAFSDVFTEQPRSVEALRPLAELGLARVYVGLESGDEAVLRFLAKPAESEEALRFVANLKAAGIAVGVIVLVGAGGDRFPGHVPETVRLVSRMPLDDRDLVYVSPLVEEPGADWARRAAKEEVRALSDAEMATQENALRRGLFAALGTHRPRVSRYDVRSFIYQG